jgi:hypothetical protein
MTTPDTILAKIKKLQALTVERGATPEEAANAAAKAQALLFEHNLAQADVDTKEQAGTDPYGKVETILEGANRNTVTWRRSLLHIIAKYNFCSAIQHSGETRMSLIGKRSHVETVLYLNSILVREIERLATAAARTILSDRAAYRLSFCRGAVATIYSRLAEQYRQSEHTATQTGTAEQGNRNAVILRTQAEALNHAVAHFYPRLRTTTSRARIGSADGYAAGKAAGAGISMHRGIGSRAAAGYLN